jgi:hypothetical protein
MTQPNETSDDRWMHAVAMLVFLAICAGGVWWLRSINFFYFKATFPLAEIGAFMICALIVVINIAMRIPMLLRWLRARIRNSG